MKKLILVVMTSLFCMSAFSSVQSVYDKLIRATGEKPIPIYVNRGVLRSCSLACTDGKHIVVSIELLSLVKNDDELAGVIGHEMGHRYYKSELSADIQGLLYAQKAGYSYCKAAQFMKGFMADPSHPSGAVRYRNTGCPQKWLP